mgnify:CR=1 FL=1
MGDLRNPAEAARFFIEGREALGNRIMVGLAHKKRGAENRMNSLDAIKTVREDILMLATRHGASNVRIFGSVVRGEDTENSDVDFLVDMGEGCSLYDLTGLQQDLERLLGRRADVLTVSGISQYLKSRILAEAKPL